MARPGNFDILPLLALWPLFYILQIRREPRPFPKLIIKREVKEIDDFTADDFEIIGYNPHPKLTMPMAV